MITASVVTYNTKAEELKNCLENLNHELIKKVFVIDNSKQKYIEEICQSFEYVVYRASDNIGYGAAHNIAIRDSLITKSKYHLVVNSDISFDKEVISELYSYMNGNVNMCDLYSLLPDFAGNMLRVGINKFERNIKGYSKASAMLLPPNSSRSV